MRRLWITLKKHQTAFLSLEDYQYDIYRGYIAFAFSVIVFVCLFVCLSVNSYFSVKDFSATTWVRILKFGKRLDSDELYCVTKNSHIFHISPFICSFFLFPMRERSGSVVECLTRDRRAGVRASPASLCCGPWARHIYPSLVLVQPRKTRPYITERLLMGCKESNQINKNFLSSGNFCHRFLSSYWSQCFQILCTPLGRQSVLCKWKLWCLSSFCLLFSIFSFFSFCHS